MTMHLFYDSTLNTWRLITEKLPEKPHPPIPIYKRSQNESPDYYLDLERYEFDIAALKQNALTVGNEELIPVFPRPHVSGFIIPKNFKPDELYFWPGGVDILEKIPPVAILTLPEEKKNTMENLTKEQANSVYHCIDCGVEIKFSAAKTHELCEKCLNHFNREYNTGIVAAPKEHVYTDKEIIGLAEKEIESLRQQLKERDELIANLKQDIVRLIEDVNKAYEH